MSSKTLDKLMMLLAIGLLIFFAFIVAGCSEPTPNKVLISQAQECYDANMRAVFIGPYGASGNQYRVQCRPHREPKE